MDQGSDDYLEKRNERPSPVVLPDPFVHQDGVQVGRAAQILDLGGKTERYPVEG